MFTIFNNLYGGIQKLFMLEFGKCVWLNFKQLGGKILNVYGGFQQFYEFEF